MKKLNITKKQYDESKYFNKKYGAIKFVSESGKHYKTDKGVVLALEGTEEPMKEDGDSIMDRQLDDNQEADKKDGGDNEGDITRGELTDMLKDVVKEVEKVCDDQDISFEDVAGIEKPEGESDEEADKDEVVATKDEVAEVLAGVIDTVEKVADKNDIELPEEEEDDGEDADKGGDDGDKADGDDGEVTVDEGCDCGKKDCPECNPDHKPATEGCEGGECCPTCGAPMKKECGTACECGDKPDKFMEARKARRAKLVREAVRRLRAKKVRESVVRRAKVRKVLESIRKRRLAKKVMESIRRRRAMKKVMESRKARVLAARKDRKVMESIRARRAARMRRLAK
jgi:hypothetical protein